VQVRPSVPLRRRAHHDAGVGEVEHRIGPGAEGKLLQITAKQFVPAALTSNSLKNARDLTAKRDDQLGFGQGQLLFQPHHALPGVLLELASGLSFGPGTPLAADGLAIARQAGDRWEEALATNALAHAAWELYEYDEAKRRVEEALATFEEVGDRPGMALSLRMVADTLWYNGERGMARPTYQKSLALYRETVDRWGAGRLLVRMGLMTAYQLGEFPEARRLVEAGRATFARIDDRPGMAVPIAYLGVVAGLMGDYDESVRLLGEYVALGKELGNRERVAYGRGLLGIIGLWEGALEEAKGYLQEGIATAWATDGAWYVALASTGLAELAYERGQYRAARLHASEALAYFRESGAIPWSWMPSYALGETARAQGELGKAWQHLRESLRASVITWAIVSTSSVLCAMAALRVQRGGRSRRSNGWSLFSIIARRWRTMGNGRGDCWPSWKPSFRRTCSPPLRSAARGSSLRRS
jgi:tetratricopeptide (TPR) repeat protein